MFLYVIKSICCIFDIIACKCLILITCTGFLYFSVTSAPWFCVTELACSTRHYLFYIWFTVRLPRLIKLICLLKFMSDINLRFSRRWEGYHCYGINYKLPPARQISLVHKVTERWSRVFGSNHRVCNRRIQSPTVFRPRTWVTALFWGITIWNLPSWLFSTSNLSDLCPTLAKWKCRKVQSGKELEWNLPLLRFWW